MVKVYIIKNIDETTVKILNKKINEKKYKLFKSRNLKKEICRQCQEIT